jgi:hypothetical protein
MQYKAGSVAVTSGSNIVTGTDTLWLANLTAGDIFTVSPGGVWYQIASVDSSTQLTLTAPYGGSTAAAQDYAVTRDFTPNLNLPYPVRGDIETPAIVARALLAIDAELKRLSDIVDNP